MAIPDRRSRRQAAARTRATEEGEQVSATGYSRSGQGEPLVLLHALGTSRAAWDAIMPALAERFDVVAVDLPGFGASAPLPAGIEPSPAELATAVAGMLNDLGIDRLIWWGTPSAAGWPWNWPRPARSGR
jgi:pimeloyl-ACP methyl ester carboxylesterase